LTSTWQRHSLSSLPTFPTVLGFKNRRFQF
jgi:hypothetical protein